MPTTVWPAQGTIFAVDLTGTGTYTVINGITSITGLGGGSVAQAKTTSLASLAHTFRGTIPDPSEVSFDLNFDPTDATHKFLRTTKDTPSGGPYSWKATYSTGTTISTEIFSGNMSEFAGADAADVEDNLTASFTVKPSGVITHAP